MSKQVIYSTFHKKYKSFMQDNYLNVDVIMKACEKDSNNAVPNFFLFTFLDIILSGAITTSLIYMLTIYFSLH